MSPTIDQMTRARARHLMRELLSSLDPVSQGQSTYQTAHQYRDLADCYEVVSRTSSCPEYELREARRYRAHADSLSSIAT